MKKYSIFLLAAIALGFSACEDTSDLGITQINEQQPIVEANGITLTPSNPYTTTIDLEHNMLEKTLVTTVSSTEGLPENAELSLVLAVAKDENMADAHTLPIEDGYVNSVDLREVIVEMYGITPEVVKPWMGIEAYVSMGTQMSRLGGDDFYYQKQQVNVLPEDLKLNIEKSYTLGGTITQKMDHSDLHPYVDNNFIAVFEVTSAQASAGFEWYIIPESLGANPDPALCWGPGVGGDLVLGAKGKITSAGRYRLVADMLAKTYTLSYAYEVLYTPGSGNGWSQDASMKLYTNNYSTYFGFTMTGTPGSTEKGEFKLCATLNWDMNWGLDGDKLVTNGPNIVTDPAGLWFVKADLNGLWIWTLKTDKIGIIGLNGDWDNDIFMTPSADMLKWTAEITANSDTEFKLRVNQDWGANFGGDKNALSLDGSNIAIGAGKYLVTFDISTVPYKCTVEAK